jgi:hypothetical protein
MSKKLECSTEGSLLVQYIAGFDLLEHIVYGGRANLHSLAFTAPYVPSHNSAERLSPDDEQFGKFLEGPRSTVVLYKSISTQTRTLSRLGTFSQS